MSTEEISPAKESVTCTIEETGIWCPKVFGALLEDPSTHDVTFKTSDGGSVSAHRVIVAAGSPVFHAMLYGNMKESSQKEIDLPNVTEDILTNLLSFMYTGKVCFSMDRCVHVLDAAHYFGIEILESSCADYINTTLTIDNCCENITFAHKKNFQVLVEKCLSFMFTHAVELIKLTSFKELPVEVLLAFLESSDVCAEEIDLFLAAVEWYKHQSGQNTKVTKSIFQMIRYPLISKSDLIHKVRPVQEIDSLLYTAALEYHLLPEEYSGPPEQVSSRNAFFKVISVTSNTVTLEKNGDKMMVSRVGSNSWRESLCAIKVVPLENKPLKFKLCLETCRDLNFIRFSLKSVKFQNISCEGSNTIGFNATHLRRGEATDVTVSLTWQGAAITIGSKSQTTALVKDTALFLCVYLYYSSDRLVISYS